MFKIRKPDENIEKQKGKRVRSKLALFLAATMLTSAPMQAFAEVEGSGQKEITTDVEESQELAEDSSLPVEKESSEEPTEIDSQVTAATSTEEESVTTGEDFESEKRDTEDEEGLESELEEMETRGASKALKIASNAVVPQDFAIKPWEATEENHDEQHWGFNVYYLDETDEHHVEKDENFNLKYQMVFSNSVNLLPGSVIITIPKYLMENRSGKGLEPADIAVPKIKMNESQLEKTDDVRMMVGEIMENGTYRKADTQPFNYFTANVDGQEVLVFFNYDKIVAGSNHSWQVAYENINLMNYRDGSEWTLPAEAAVTIVNNVVDSNYDTMYIQKSSPEPLSGKIDTSVKLQSVSKSPHNIPDKSYGPELYTQKQIEKVLNKNYLSKERKEIVTDPSKMKDYYFMSWDVSVVGSANQYWDLIVGDAVTASYEDQQAADSLVIGYSISDKEISDELKARTEKNGMTLPTAMQGDDPVCIVEEGSDSLIHTTFTVVTAHKKHAEYDPSGNFKKYDALYPELSNTIDVRLVPHDGLDDPMKAQASARHSYKKYTWEYKAGGVNVQKWNEDGSTEISYPGLLEKYVHLGKEKKDLGKLKYTNHGYVDKGFDITHYTDSATDADRLGQYRDGAYYDVMLADDILYASNSESAAEIHQLTKDDYYFDSVRFRRKEQGWDVWEDEEAAYESFPDNSKNSLDMTVYAMFSKDEGLEKDEHGWVKVGSGIPYIETREMDDAYFQYAFSKEWLEREPYRVKAEYKSLNYRSDVYIDVDLCLRNAEESKTLRNLVYDADGNRKDFSKLSIENLPALTAVANKVEEGKKDELVNLHYVPKPGNYEGRTDLIEFTDKLYPEYADSDEEGGSYRPMRRSAYKHLEKLSTIAGSTKNSKVENDPEHNRVAVQYTLTATDGYNVYNAELMEDLKKWGEAGEDYVSPGKNEFVFYDLLPEGMEFDPAYEITVGRLTSSPNEQNVNRWSKNQVRYEFDPEQDIVKNWRDTNRTLLKFHIRYDGADAAVYMNGRWAEVWGIQFQAYYDWTKKELISVTEEANANIAAFMTEGTDQEKELLGQHWDNSNGSGTVFKDNGEVPEHGNYLGFFDKGNLDETDQGKDAYRILYAQDWFGKSFTVASQDFIKKLVRADSDPTGPFVHTTAVEPEGTYTYEITLKTTKSLKDLVVFDRLEYALEDRAQIKQGDKDFDFEDESWVGTFLGVDTAEAKSRGIAPVVYFNKTREATLPENPNQEYSTGIQELDDLLTEENGWIPSTEWKESYSEVKAIAVDFRKMQEGEDFELKAGQSISFRIQMQAPKDTGSINWAYNNPSYFSSAKDNDSSVQDRRPTYVIGNWTRVRLGASRDIVVRKQFEGDVPEKRKDEEFEFTVYRSVYEERDEESGSLNRKKLPYQNQVYSLWTVPTEDTASVRVDEELHATDADGKFILKAGQQAVFSGIPISDAGDFIIEEEENPFWEVTKKEAVQNEQGQFLYEITNRFRPVVYVQKKLTAVPKDMAEAVKNREFTFQLLNSEGEAKANETFWIVESARTDGGIPIKKKERKSDKDGFFTLREGEIAAFFLKDVGESYKLREYNFDHSEIKEELVTDSIGPDWLVRKNSVEGTAAINGSLAQIENIYRWKDLELKKLISHKPSDESKYSSSKFTFQLMEITSDGKEIPAVGKSWAILGTAGKPLSGEDNTGITGTDGSFTAAIAEKTVRIRGLEAGKKYVVRETGFDTALFTMVNEGTVSFTVPTYASYRAASITNDWKKRPFFVSKTVLSDMNQGTDQSTLSFTFELKRKNKKGELELVKNTPFDILENGVVVGQFVTGDDGTFQISGKQTARFEDFGEEGTVYSVKETDSNGLKRIIPAEGESLSGSLHGDETTAAFYNGSDGVLVFGKDYVVGEDVNGEAQSMVDTKSWSLRAELRIEYRRRGEEEWNPIEYYTNVLHVRKIGSSSDLYGGELNTIGAYPGDRFVIYGEFLDASRKKTAVSDAEFRIIEIDTTKSSVMSDKNIRRIYQIFPENGKALTLNKDNPVGIITNKVDIITEKSIIYKRRDTVGQQPRSKDEALLFIVEKYTGSMWLPEADVEYYVNYNNTIHLTDQEGTVRLTGRDNGYVDDLWIIFPEKKVVINPANPEVGSLRIRELGSDSELWGELKGYAYSSDPSRQYSFAKTDADVFVNGNDIGKIRIEKRINGRSTDERFSFRLSQVAGIKEERRLENYKKEDITDLSPAVNRTYRVLDRVSGSQIDTGVTAEDGTFTLRAGEAAEFSVGKSTLWLCEELNTESKYHLKEISGDMVKEMSPNSALISPGKASPIVRVSYGDENQSFQNRNLRIRTVEELRAALGNEWYDHYEWYTDPELTKPFIETDQDCEVYGASFILSKNTINKDAEKLVFGPKSKYQSVIQGVPYTNAGGRNEIRRYDVGNTSYYLSEGDKDIYFPKYSSGMFEDSKATEIIFDDNVNTSIVEDMSYMFRNSKVENIDLSRWDTSSVRDMSSMFNRSAATYIDIRGFGTSHPTRMSYMFTGSSNLQEIKFPEHWDLSNVTSLAGLFYSCGKLKTVDLSGFENTSGVTTMEEMFRYCDSLEEIDLTGMDASSVTTMKKMFEYCKQLKKIRFGDQFNTSKVTDMEEMFSECNSLEVIEFGTQFDTSSVTDMSKMFYRNYNLKELDLSFFNTENVRNMSYMFSDAIGLTKLNLGGFAIKENTYVQTAYMLEDTAFLKEITIGDQSMARVLGTLPKDIVLSYYYDRYSGASTKYIDYERVGNHSFRRIEISAMWKKADGDDTFETSKFPNEAGTYVRVTEDKIAYTPYVYKG